jgi:hypothetical protein
MLSKESILFFIGAIGIISSIYAFFGVPGGVSIGAATLLFTALISVVYIYGFKFLRSKVKANYVRVDEFLEKNINSFSDLKCIFSSADRLRIAFESLLPRAGSSIKNKARVTLIVRSRNNSEAQRVKENVERLAQLLKKYAIDFTCHYVEWDHFMINGIILDENQAIIGIYTRPENITVNLHHKHLLINRLNSDYEKFLYESLNGAFETLQKNAHLTQP